MTTPKAGTIETIFPTGHASPVMVMAVSADRRYLATADAETIRLWEISTGYLIRIFTHSDRQFLEMDFHPSGSALLLSNPGKKQGPQLLDLETGETTSVGSNLRYGIQFISAQQILGFQDGDLLGLWDVEAAAGRNFPTEPSPEIGKTTSFDIHKGLQYVVTGHEDGHVICRDIATQKVLQQVQLTGYSIEKLVIDPNDQPRFIIVCLCIDDGLDKEYYLYDMHRKSAPRKLMLFPIQSNGQIGREGKKLPGTYPDMKVKSLEISGKGSLLSAVFYDLSIFYDAYSVYFWPMVEGVPGEGFEITGEEGVKYQCARLLGGRGELVLGSSRGDAELWRTDSIAEQQEELQPIRVFRGQSEKVYFGAMTDKYIVEGSGDLSIQIWDRIKGGIRATFNKTTFSDDRVAGKTHSQCLAISPDQKLLAVGNSLGWIQLWSLESLGTKPLYQHQIAGELIRSIRFSEDNHSLAIGTVLESVTGSMNFGAYDPSRAYLLDINTQILELKISGEANDYYQVNISAKFNCLIIYAQPHHSSVGLTGVGPARPFNNVTFFNLDTGLSLSKRLDLSAEGFRMSRDGRFLFSIDSTSGAILQTWDLADLNWDQVDDFQPKSQVLSGLGQVGVESFEICSDRNLLLARKYDDNACLLDMVTGELLQSYEGHDDDYSLAFSLDYQFILSSSTDTSTKIWDRASGEEVATLLSIGEADWVVLSPSGLFDASPGAMNKLHFVIGLETIDLDQLKKRYYEPGLLNMLLGGRQDQIRDVSVFESAPLFPKIKKAEIDKEGMLQVELEERSGGLGKVWLKINGKEVIEDANPDRRGSFSVALEPYKQHFHPGSWDNQIDLIAFNEEGWLRSRPHIISEYWPSFVSGKAGRRAKKKQKEKESGRDQQLFAVFIGTSTYKIKNLILDYPDLDAARLAQALELSGQELFQKTYIRQFVSEPDPDSPEQVLANKENIRQAFDEFSRLAKPRDVLLIFLSGHGETHGSGDDVEFFYLMKDLPEVNLASEQVRQVGTISTSELTSWIKDIAARKQVLILDACHSGGFTKSFGKGKSLGSTQQRALEEMKDRTGMWVLAGSADGKESFENYALGQGLLTYSLLKGIKGGALRSEDEIPLIDVQLLLGYAMQEVPNLARRAGREQVPVLSVPQDGGQSFSLGLAKEEIRAQIELPSPKPTLVRSTFLHLSQYFDTLKLSYELDRLFKLEQTKWLRRNDQASYLFIDENYFPGAFKICGIYEEHEDGYEVKGHLFEGQDPVQETAFTVQGTTVQQLAEALEEKVLALLETNK